MLKYRHEETDINALEQETLVKVTKKMKFFENMNKKTLNVQMGLHQRCCRAMRYHFSPRGAVLFEKGQQPGFLYIILTGDVNIFQAKSSVQISREREWLDKTCNLKALVIGDDSSSGKRGAQDESKEVRRQGLVVENKRKTILYKIGPLEFTSVQKRYLASKSKQRLLDIKEQGEVSESESESEGEGTTFNATTYQQSTVNDGGSGRVSDSDYGASDSDEEEDEAGPEQADRLMYKWFGEIDPSDIENKEKFFTNGIINIEHEVTLGAGYVIGELELRKRKAYTRTLICKSDCQFAVLSAQDYSEILLQLKNKKRREKINFVEFNMLPEIPRYITQKVVAFMKKEKLIKGQKIYKERDTPIKMYLIVEGEIEVYSLVLHTLT